jgi:HAD superfamily hydrolase (TIGR01549 family)
MMRNLDLNLEGISAVCFDVFGTLIQHGRRHWHPYRLLLLTSAPLKTLTCLPLLTRNVGIEVFARKLGLMAELPMMEQALTEELAEMRCFPEVDRVLEALQQAGKKIAVCSNLPAAYGPSVRELLPGLDAYVFSFEQGVAQPDPAIYQAVCGALQRQPNEILFIGDRQWCDLHGPRALGMPTRRLDRLRGQTLLDVLDGKQPG